jgi:hypothetical protein
VEGSCEFGIEPSGSMKCWDEQMKYEITYMNITDYFIARICVCVWGGGDEHYEKICLALHFLAHLSAYQRVHL